MRAYYDPTSVSVIDEAREDGRSAVYGYTPEQMRERYPNILLLPWEDAWQRYDAARAAEVCSICEEITQEDFNYMLAVLPPAQWKHSDNAESFKISEAITLDLTMAYVRIGERYFKMGCRFSTSHDDLLWALRFDSRINWNEEVTNQ